jgi:hypothetical protein
VKIPARGGNLPGTYQVDADLIPPPTYSTRCGEKQARRLLTNIKVLGQRLHGGLPGRSGPTGDRTRLARRGPQSRLPELADQHLIGGKPVEMLPIGPEDFCAQPRV